VQLRETQTGFQRSLTTNERGVFVGSLLPLGTYDVAGRGVGFAEARKTGITLHVGETVDLQVKLGAVQLQAVTVTAAQPVVDATRIENATRLPDAVMTGLPNNGRNYLNFTLLTPNVAIVQGPDGDELAIAGQRGIHNNVSVDGADFNNPFFGEQRGGQRPAFTFNLDAVQEVVVTAGGANAEFGRSSSGFVNVITKSGTNQVRGSLHYFGKYDTFAADPRHASISYTPDFTQHQFGFTLGGPVRRDKMFFFVAYDQQLFDEVKQKDPNRIPSAPLRAWLDSAFGGALRNDYGPISRTNDARAALVKFDWRLSDRHNFSLKYNYTWSEQKNGTFDVDTWMRSANGLERDWSNAVNGSLVSFLSSRLSNEFRFQFSREDRPRPYGGAINPATGRPFPDTGMDFQYGYRFGMPFFLPIKDHDTRQQLLDNVSLTRGDHLIKFGGEFNRTATNQTFIGFGNGRVIFSSVNGFLNFVAGGNNYVECSDNSSNTTGACPLGTTITGPVLLYLQQAGVGGRTVEQAGTQELVQRELALFLQDTWKPDPRWTINYGLRWEAQIEPDPITPPASVFFAPFIGATSKGQAFPSDGKIPSDWKMFQPRLGFAYDVDGSGRHVLRASAGVYYARLAGLNLASVRSTNGSIGQTLFRNSALTGILGPPPAYGQLLAPPGGAPFDPSVFVADKHLQNPRTINYTVGYETQLGSELGFSITGTHARTDHLLRFIDRNDGAFGKPWATGLPGGNGLATLTTLESSARSRYWGVTFALKRVLDPHVQFQLNYTLSYDKSDDDNERDPFSFRYARASNLGPEYNWSDRDQRHRFNGWMLANVGGFSIDNRVSIYSAQPTSMSCGPSPSNPFAPPKGQRATSPQDRRCADGTILQRNTLRKDNHFFSWDVRVSRHIAFGRQGALEALVEVFDVTNTDNFRDPAGTSLLFNFDGTIRSGLGDPRQAQAGLRWTF
jgi:TonB dependent receptor/Carboxypeptidase regulatory-like domain